MLPIAIKLLRPFEVIEVAQLLLHQLLKDNAWLLRAVFVDGLFEDEAFVLVLINTLYVDWQTGESGRGILLFLDFGLAEDLVVGFELLSVDIDNASGKGVHFELFNVVVHLMVLGIDVVLLFVGKEGGVVVVEVPLLSG